MIYRHSLRIRAPLAAVREFHTLSANLFAITPPMFVVKVHSAPERMAEGDEIDFTMWLGPLPIHWRPRVSDVSPTGFLDLQQEGPFAFWAHRHTFRPVEKGVTEVVDEVQARLKRHLLWGPLGLGMWLGMPLLFAYRGWRARRILERSAA